MVLQVRVERVSRGVKLYELANALGLDTQLWAKYEKGLMDTPADVAERAGELFGKSAAELFQTVDAEPLVMAGAGPG